MPYTEVMQSSDWFCLSDMLSMLIVNTKPASGLLADCIDKKEIEYHASTVVHWEKKNDERYN